MENKPVTYEVDLEIDRAVVDEFDIWLERHVADMLTLPGFKSASVLIPQSHDAAAGAVQRRVVQYQLESRAALERYLSEHAPIMRKEAIERFGNHLRAERRLSQPLGPAEAKTACLNCGSPLRGQYCNQCGQRSKVRLITLWELVRDVIDDLFELDSRLWRTLRPLLMRPGFLTVEYLAGKRVRYVPPFRMYLVISLVFFLLASLGNGEISVTSPDAALDDETGVFLTFELDDEAPGLDSPAPDGTAAGSREETAEERCRRVVGQIREQAQDMTPQAEDVLTARCTKITGDPDAFVAAIVNNIPTTMFFFLPLIAAVLKLLYAGSHRYYVEHLLFVVHYHAFFFLIITLSIVLWRLSDWIPYGSVPAGLFTIAVVVYIPVYLFRGMAVVYRQDAGLTALKFVFLLGAYFASLLITLALTVLVTALTV